MEKYPGEASGDGYPSTAMKETLGRARAVSRIACTVLLQGESGSGKDYLARWIHNHSPRASGPFFSINCAALPEQLMESELFGYERGAFTGAAVKKRGLLELARDGTILLNEIGELSLGLQAKLLEFLDTKTFVRVGGQRFIRVDIRLIAATHRNLKEEVSAGRFMGPLYYRLSVFPIHIPPLRERFADIPVLVWELLSLLARDMRLNQVPVVSSDQMEVLCRYDWPGNVRELRNILQRSLVFYNGGELTLSLPEGCEATEGGSNVIVPVPTQGLQDVVDEVIKSLCVDALQRCMGNRREAAKLLKITRGALYRYMKKFQISSAI
jgi:transcriptional regulator with PAS, ATPase and Fis domain